MASIVHAFDPLLGRHVAVKLLHASLVEQAGEVDAFLREARTTAQLEHPNIVPVYDLASGQRSEWACFAMKLVQGQSLAERMAALGDARLSTSELPRLLDVLLKICDAISYAHERRVLHLDLKPQNVMIGSHGQVYVMDWGIAVRCTRSESGRLVPLDRHGSMRGTLAYMSPEQVDPELTDVDERADVYGIGAIIYELLTGKPPFAPGDATDDVERLRTHVVPDALAAAAPVRVPPGLARIAMRALSRHLDERYPTVLALRAELESLVRGGGWFQVRTFEPGELIVCEGDEAHEAYILVEGECDVFKRSGPSQVHLRLMRQGEVFGEAAIFTGGTRTASVRAKSAVTVRVVTREALEWELGSIGVLGSFVHAIAERFREADDERVALRAQIAALTAARAKERT
jgi:serine/threonine-protein kinase